MVVFGILVKILHLPPIVNTMNKRIPALPDLSRALRNGFHSSFSIASAIRNEGIVLPI
jgi:hypothetical protein